MPNNPHYKNSKSQFAFGAKKALFGGTQQSRIDNEDTSTGNKMTTHSATTEETFTRQQELAAFRKDILHTVQTLEKDLMNKLDITLKPLVDQLQDLQSTLQQTTQKAEMALGLTDSLKTENCKLRQDLLDLKDKTILMDRASRRKHVKFRGLPEGPESSQKLISKINIWLNEVLEIGESPTPIAHRAYRLGVLMPQGRSTPRDIVVELADDVTNMKIMNPARQQGHLQYQAEKIQVYQDLPTEAIQIRKSLKMVTQALRDAKIKYRRAPTGKLSVYHKG